MSNKNNLKIGIVITLIVILILIALYLIIPNIITSISLTGELKNKPINCTVESRNGSLCGEIYEPVCGWFDPQKIQCIKYPCAKTYSNKCFACLDENVLSFTKGECPN
ncbi:MAG: hypothetical protein WC796_05175 [Candidatus Pacearchaeota archaeon]|jgi:hypothetical protein